MKAHQLAGKLPAMDSENGIMTTHTDKSKQNRNRSVARQRPEKQNDSKSALQYLNNRPEAIAQSKLQELANRSAQAKQLMAAQNMANNSPRAAQLVQMQAMTGEYSAEPIQQQGMEEEELLQGKFDPVQKMDDEELLQGKFDPVQMKPNRTGLPDRLKSGIENLSGYTMDDVNVHYNSDKPSQLQAHAYAQGTDIHMAPGQEKHLPHEAWHVVQQKQGRVTPTRQMMGKVNVNDDIGLEKEADVMGARALNSGAGQTRQPAELDSTNTAGVAAQLVSDEEFEALQNERNSARRAQIFADDGPITAEERGPSAADGFMTDDGRLPDTDAADNEAFNNVTLGADSTTAVSGSVGVADVMGAGLAAGMGVAEALPGINLATNVVGVVESGVRGHAAHRRAGVMGAAKDGAGTRAEGVLALGEKEQSRETKRRAARGVGGAVQTGFAIGGIAAGAATGGAGLLVVAGIIGSMKAAETFYNLYRKDKGKALSEMHAQQLLFAAQAGDESVIAALKELGVQTEDLANPKVWETAVKRLASMMSVATSEFQKAGTYRDPSIATPDNADEG